MSARSPRRAANRRVHAQSAAACALPRRPGASPLRIRRSG
ncbi:hypothetical protein GLE_3606 [Lysobacter enzymogenes]|uniref:Uncharacterized protein n=1 Tax=Lysobacter enzymogenes TaxID=69 RepID=A0A0S2DK07_LYSEN|nr:hypothetical protein GLE_3606 [Lysobacter enzymogenes]